MAKAFLQNLLQMHNSVNNQNELCAICLEKFGTLSPETGTIEVEMRLPCNHFIGSACIAIWLKDHNSCPICRREFFPASPQPFLEDDHMDDQEDEGDQRSIREINDDNCARLDLVMEVAMISGMIVQKLTELETFSEGHSQWCIVAVSIYMASHLTGQSRSPREIAAVTGIDAEHIRWTYDRLYPERETLVDIDILSLLDEVFDKVAPLRWPAPGYEFTDEQIEDGHVLQMLREGCNEGCEELGLDADVAEFTLRIAAKWFSAGLMDRMSPREMVAASIYMAGHMIRNPFRARRVAEVVGTSEFRVRSAYETAHAHQHLLAGQPWLESIGRGSMESVLGRLPAPWATHWE